MLVINNFINEIKNIFKYIKEHPVSSIFFLIAFLVLSPIAYLFILDVILPDYCFQIFREEYCPNYIRAFQDFAIIFSYIFAFIVGFLIYKFFKFIKISANRWFLFTSILIILTITSYTVFNIIRSNILSSSCSPNIWWLWFAGYYCWKNYYLLNFYPWVIFWFFWFIWFILYVSFFSKKILKTENNIFISTKIIVNYLIIMLTPLSLMTLLLIWSSRYYWYLTFKEVWQCWLSSFIYINYFITLLYSYILRNNKWWHIYLFGFITTLIEIFIAILILKYHNFTF